MAEGAAVIETKVVTGQTSVVQKRANGSAFWVITFTYNDATTQVVPIPLY